MAAWVSVHRVLRLANPLQVWPWDGRCASFGRDCLNQPRMFAEAPLVGVAWDGQWDGIEPGSYREALAHVGRVRYLMQFGWDDAIELDVGIPVLNYSGPEWKVIDGNHRLAAAALRGDEHILVTVGGQLDHATALLGVTEEALTEFGEEG